MLNLQQYHCENLRTRIYILRFDLSVWWTELA